MLIAGTRSMETRGRRAPLERMAPYRKSQRGMTLMEVMVASAIGLVVTSAMLLLMANTLGSGARTIEMTRLQQEMRAAMQMMTRDVRRASYTSEAILCFGNSDCSTDGTFANGLPGDITINNDNDCFIFEMDRDHDGDATVDAPGGFRWRNVSGIRNSDNTVRGRDVWRRRSVDERQSR